MSPPGYLEVFSAPPFTPGNLGAEDSELPISFSASPILTPVPESSSTLAILALGTLGAASTLKRQLKTSKSTEEDCTIHWRSPSSQAIANNHGLIPTMSVVESINGKFTGGISLALFVLG